MTEEYLESLIQKYADGSASDREIEELMIWYRSSPITDVKWPMEDADERDRLHKRMLDRLKLVITPKVAVLPWYASMKVAASIILVLGLGSMVYYFLRPGTSSYYTISNPSGKIQLVTLPDNSHVWLNASSTLKYARSFQSHRELLLDGEAYFEVSHDAAHPFTVETGKVSTSVLGTSFNISAYGSDEQISVSVKTGKVRVNEDAKELAILMPSKVLQFNKRTHIANVSEIDTSGISNWKEGWLQFHGETLAEIAKSLERWYGYSIRFSDQHIATCRFYLSIENKNSVNQCFELLSQVTNLNYTIDSKEKTITLSGTCN